jgi:hypothetical protein
VDLFRQLLTDALIFGSTGGLLRLPFCGGTGRIGGLKFKQNKGIEHGGF